MSGSRASVIEEVELGFMIRREIWVDDGISCSSDG